MPLLHRRIVRSRVAVAAAILLGPVLAACGAHAGRHLLGVPLPFGARRELSEEQQARQAVNRLTFGPRPGDVDQVRRVGVDRWIAQQLAPDRLADTAWNALAAHLRTPDADAHALADSFPPLDLYIRALRRARGLADTAPFVLTPDDSGAWRRLADTANRRVNVILAARVARAEIGEQQLTEVMTDFWENHFSVYTGKMPTRFTLLAYDRDVIRPRALGRFRDLLGAVAHSAAMLYFLDNAQSRADAGHVTLAEWRAAQRANRAPRAGRRRGGLNENYARELMELHTLGVDGGYTQQDVIEVARALTGWSLDDPRAGGGFVFRPEAHDGDAKVVLGHELTAGRGIEDGEEVLDIVARHPATAHFIALKLARRFVSDAPPPALVARAAATFTRTDGDIRETLRTILTAPEFFSHAAYRAKVKSPFELVVSARRALGARPDTTAATAQAIARLGEPLYGHLAPDGWPETGAAWMNSGALLARINLGATLAAGRLPGVALARWPVAATLATASRDAQVDGVVDALLEGEASPDTRAILGRGDGPPKLATLVGLALGAPEFQRR